jgi:neutral trehalase
MSDTNGKKLMNVDDNDMDIDSSFKATDSGLNDALMEPHHDPTGIELSPSSKLRQWIDTAYSTRAGGEDYDELGIPSAIDRRIHHPQLRTVGPQSNDLYQRSFFVAALSILIGIFVATSLSTLKRADTDVTIMKKAWEQTCSVFCDSKLLYAVQISNIFNDSKTFVDMPLVMDPSDVLIAYNAQFGDIHPRKEDLETFINKYFLPAGSETVPHIPEDYIEFPPILSSLRNETLREFAFQVHSLWLLLGRKIHENVKIWPQRFTHVWQPFPMIISGGRFRETYYWDAYWIVLGLLQSNMLKTATGLAYNLLHLLRTFGFVPNGARTYYCYPGRSQPPFLSSIVKEIYDANGRNNSFLLESYLELQNEYKWWMKSGEWGHAVHIVADIPGSSSTMLHKTFVLNRYVTDQHIPRPESWIEDIQSAMSAGFDPSDAGAQLLYAEVAAAAESGWDFTTRWFKNHTISSTVTSGVIPVDLNAIMLIFEKNMASFAKALSDNVLLCMNDEYEANIFCQLALDSVDIKGETPIDDFIKFHQISDIWARQSLQYAQAAQFREEAIDILMWDGEQFRWRDLIITQELRQSRDIELSDICGPIAHSLPQELVQTNKHFHKAPDSKFSLPSKNGKESSGKYGCIDRRGILIGIAVSHRYQQRADLKLGRNVFHSNVTAASDYIPLWAGIVDKSDTDRILGIVDSFERSGLFHPAGVSSTATSSSEQWDLPNAFAPIQHMIYTGFNNTGNVVAMKLAEEIARRFLNTAVLAFSRHQLVFEKYDALNIGCGGYGGEYIPQIGFGWSNGVLLEIMSRYNFSTLD